MNWHPFAERFPLLDGAEYEAFLASIRETGGNDTPILYRTLPDGSVQGLDGRNRYKACRELGIEPYLAEVVVEDANVKAFILRKNVYRRHLTPEQRRFLVQELTEDGMSTRAIASVLGVNQSTIVRDQRSGDANASPDKVQGQDGKTYTRRQKKEVVELAPAPEPAPIGGGHMCAMSDHPSSSQPVEPQPLSFDAHAQGMVAWVNQLAAEQPDDLDGAAGCALLQAILEVQKQFKCWTMGVKYTPPTPPAPPPAPEPKKVEPPAEVPIPASLDTPEFRELWQDWKQHRIEKGGSSKKKLTPTSVKRQLRRLEKMGLDKAIAAMEWSIKAGWDDVYEAPAPEEKQPPYGKPHRTTETREEQFDRIGKQMGVEL